jgi:RNA:NAD 2'-phosphotransferase (TPT1/KptA family)
MTAYTDEMTEEFTAAQIAIEEEIMRDLVVSKLTKNFQSETAIVRAVYGKRDSEISTEEWQAVIQALRIVGKNKNIGLNEFVWKLA